jgi:hypothetical protein
VGFWSLSLPIKKASVFAGLYDKELIKLKFCRRTQAARAELHFNGSTIFEDGCLLHIGLPLALGMAHRVAHLVTTHHFFMTYFTLHDGFSLHLR